MKSIRDGENCRLKGNLKKGYLRLTAIGNIKHPCALLI